MREPCRRENLHSIISKITGSGNAPAETETNPAENQDTPIRTDKADSEMKIADDQLMTVKHMFPDKLDGLKNDDDMNQHANLSDCPTVGPYSCQLCHVGFLTRRELQLHVMCHGIYITDDGNGDNNASRIPEKLVSIDNQDQVDDQDKVETCRKSPVIQRNNDIAPMDNEEQKQLSPTSHGAAIMEVPTEPPGNQASKRSMSDSVVAAPITVNTAVSYGPPKVLDVLSLATATRGFKEPGSIWCSLCKCTVEKGHSCRIHQTSYHAEKKEEGFTCELCGRYYNQKRKLRTHLRNRHKGFRLQEDEGYMCWQCWQAFPEIKILEEHIVTVHGHESRRQNSTWRPNSAQVSPNGTPADPDNASGSDPSSSSSSPTPTPIPGLKRPGDVIMPTSPAKKPAPGFHDVINIGEIDGKVVINDGFVMTPDIPQRPRSNSPTTISKPGSGAPPSPPLLVSTVATAARSSPPRLAPANLPREPHQHQMDQKSGAQSPVDQTYGNRSPRDQRPGYELPGDQVQVGSSDLVSGVTHMPAGISSPALPSLLSSNTHKKKAQGSSPMKTQRCPHCSETFNKKYILQLHIQQNHGDNMHCFFCSVSCATKEALSIHIKDNHPDEVRNGKCPICQCKCLGELHQHIVQYHVKDLLMRKDKDRVLSTCPICNETTADTYHLRWHMLKMHRGHAAAAEHLMDGGVVAEQLETSSESGSSVTSEHGRQATDMTSHTIKDEADEPEGINDDVEIVFVCDKNLASDWSERATSEKPASDATSPPPPNVVHSIKTPADSSGGLDTSPKPKPLSERVSADHVHSTTDYMEPKSPPGSTSGVTPGSGHDYTQLSEESCIFCFSSFDTKSDLVSHLRTTHGWVEAFTCPVCNYVSSNYANLVEHFCLSHFHPLKHTIAGSQAEIKCLKCDIIFQDITHLKKHASALHSFQLPATPTYNTFKCRHCNIIFEKQFDAQKHFDVYHLFRIRYKCESCRMGFTAKHDFQEHITCNHPELIKAFCPLCGLGFEVTSNLEEHVFEMHRRKSQFYCEKCGNEFADRFHVHMHIRSNCCVKWADSNFECLDCLTAFSSIAELRIHCNQRTCKK